MIDGNVLDSFFVALGFKVDDAGIKKFQTSFDQLRETALHFAEALSLPAIGYFVEEVAKGMGELRQFAQVQKLSTAELWAWNRVANENRISAEEMEESIGRLNRNVGQAALGYGRAKQIFQKLGLAAKDSRGHTKSFDVVLGELAQKMQHLSRSENLGIAARLGINPKLIPLLERGRDALHGLIEEARRENPFTDKDFADADKIDRMWRIAKEDVEILWERLAVKLFPILRQVLDRFLLFYKSLNDGSENAQKFQRALTTVQLVAESVWKDISFVTEKLINMLAWMGDNAPVWALKDALYAVALALSAIIARLVILQGMSLVKGLLSVATQVGPALTWLQGLFAGIGTAGAVAAAGIGLIVVAIAGLGWAIYRWHKLLWQDIGGVWDWILDKIVKVITFTENAWGKAKHFFGGSDTHISTILRESDAARGQTPSWAQSRWGSQSFNKSHVTVQHVTGTVIHVHSPDPEKAGEKVKEALRNDTHRSLIRNSQGFAF